MVTCGDIFNYYFRIIWRWYHLATRQCRWCLTLLKTLLAGTTSPSAQILIPRTPRVNASLFKAQILILCCWQKKMFEQAIPPHTVWWPASLLMGLVSWTMMLSSKGDNSLINLWKSGTCSSGQHKQRSWRPYKYIVLISMDPCSSNPLYLAPALYGALARGYLYS